MNRSAWRSALAGEPTATRAPSARVAPGAARRLGQGRPLRTARAAHTGQPASGQGRRRLDAASANQRRQGWGWGRRSELPCIALVLMLPRPLSRHPCLKTRFKTRYAPADGRDRGRPLRTARSRPGQGSGQSVGQLADWGSDALGYSDRGGGGDRRRRVGGPGACAAARSGVWGLVGVRAAGIIAHSRKRSVVVECCR